MPSLTSPLRHLLNSISSDALEERDGMVSIGDRAIANMRFASAIGARVKEKQLLGTLVENLHTV